VGYNNDITLTNTSTIEENNTEIINKEAVPSNRAASNLSLPECLKSFNAVENIPLHEQT